MKAIVFIYLISFDFVIILRNIHLILQIEIQTYFSILNAIENTPNNLKLREKYFLDKTFRLKRYSRGFSFLITFCCFFYCYQYQAKVFSSIFIKLPTQNCFTAYINNIRNGEKCEWLEQPKYVSTTIIIIIANICNDFDFFVFFISSSFSISKKNNNLADKWREKEKQTQQEEIQNRKINKIPRNHIKNLLNGCDSTNGPLKWNRAQFSVTEYNMRGKSFKRWSFTLQ